MVIHIEKYIGIIGSLQEYTIQVWKNRLLQCYKYINQYKFHKIVGPKYLNSKEKPASKKKSLELSFITIGTVWGE